MTCAYCGEPLPPSRTKRRKYCSPACGQRGYDSGQRFLSTAVIARKDRAPRAMATPTLPIRDRVAGVARYLTPSREEIGIGVAALAEQAGVDPDAVVAILRGETVSCAVLADVLFACGAYGSSRTTQNNAEEAV